MGNAPLDELQFIESLGLKLGQDLVGLHRMALPQQCTRQQLRFLNSAPEFVCSARDPFTQRQVRQKHRVLGGSDQQLGVGAFVTVDAQLCHPDPAGGRVEFTAAENPHDTASQRARRRGADPTANDVAVERVSEADIDVRAVVNDPDQALHLCGIHGFVTGQFAERVDVERFAQRQQLQRVHHVGARMIETVFQQCGQPGRNTGRPAQLPHPVDLAQRSGVDRALNHVPKEQRVSPRGFPHDVCAQTLQRSAEHRFDERDALLFGERLQFQTL